MSARRLLRLLKYSTVGATSIAGIATLAAAPERLVLAEQASAEDKEAGHQRALQNQFKPGFGGRDDVGSRDDDEWED